MEEIREIKVNIPKRYSPVKGCGGMYMNDTPLNRFVLSVKPLGHDEGEAVAAVQSRRKKRFDDAGELGSFSAGVTESGLDYIALLDSFDVKQCGRCPRYYAAFWLADGIEEGAEIIVTAQARKPGPEAADEAKRELRRVVHLLEETN